MKHFISFLGIIGILSAFTACSQDDGPKAVNPDNNTSTITSVSSSATPEAKSSETAATKDTTAKVSSSSVNPAIASLISSSSKAKKDKSEKEPVIVRERITIDTGATTFDDPYFSSGIFCWTEGCEEWASSASGPDVPDNGEISMGGDVPELPNYDAEPIIDGLVMKDMRDSQSYWLKDIGGTLWTQSMNITISGSNCYGGDVKNCGKYGRLYPLAAAKEACPAGWKLPSRADFEAAKDATDFWDYGGRGKDGNEDFMNEMGFYWLDTSEEAQDGDKISESCNSASCAMIFVIDAPNYGDGEKKFQKDSQAKGFSVRCVQAK